MSDGADGRYNMIKKQMQGDDPTYRTSSGQHLLAAAEASEFKNKASGTMCPVRGCGRLTPRRGDSDGDQPDMGRQDEGVRYGEERPSIPGLVE